jgi:ceramide synthetase
MVTSGFYLSLTITQFFDIKRSDFYQMFAHHLVTLGLLGMSWTYFHHRTGTMVNLLHDCADFNFDASKTAKFAKFRKNEVFLTYLFIINWIVTRVMLFPRIIHHTLFSELARPIGLYITFNTLLISLYILNLYWTYLLIVGIVRSIKRGKVTHYLNHL